MAPWESEPAGMGVGGSQMPMRCATTRMTDRHTQTHKTQGRRAEGEDHNEYQPKPSRVMGHHQKPSESMEGRRAKASGDFGRCGTQTVRWSSGSLFPSGNSKEQTYPLIFWGRLFWNSISSTVHTAPFTFSTRTKHLCRLRLCRTAFCSCVKRKREKKKVLSVNISA